MKETIFCKRDLHFQKTAARVFLHMGWLRLVGSLKLYDSFAKEPYERDDILQKRPIILSGNWYIFPQDSCACRFKYGVATIGRLLEIMGLLCRISSLLQGSFAKETYISTRQLCVSFYVWGGYDW